MTKSKDGLTTEQIERHLLRSYLVRCHQLVSKDYPEISRMSPEGSADFLLYLKETGRIDIKLYTKDIGRLGCLITELQQHDEKAE